MRPFFCDRRNTSNVRHDACRRWPSWICNFAKGRFVEAKPATPATDPTAALGRPEGRVGVGCCPLPLTRAAVQAAYRVNVGNLRDTGHSTKPTPPAASAELETVARLCLNVCSGLNPDAGSVIQSPHPKAIADSKRKIKYPLPSHPSRSAARAGPCARKSPLSDPAAARAAMPGWPILHPGRCGMP